MRRSILVFAIALACAAAAPRANASCSQAETAKTSSALDAARQTLLSLPVGDGSDTNVPRSAQTAITAMKDALDHFVVAYTQCAPSSTRLDPQKLQLEISEKAHAAAPPANPAAKGSDATSTDAATNATPTTAPSTSPSAAQSSAPSDASATPGKYGRALAFDVRSTADARHLLGIVAKFSVECGDDSVFWVFAPEGRSWREAIRWQGVPYNTLSGAYDAFDYSISPSDDAGNWFVITKNIMSGCTPNLSEIRYALLRPNEDSTRPKALLARKEPILLGGDDLGTVHAEKDSFEIRFRSTSIDPSVHSRLYIMHYGINGDTLTRTQPVAANPRDFVDEWLRVPWLEAQQWSDKTVITSLRNAHSDVEKPEKDGGPTFEAVNRCSADQNDYEVTLATSSAKKFYFRVVAEPVADANANANANATESANPEAVFTMHAVSNSPSPACKGDNLLDSMQTK